MDALTHLFLPLTVAYVLLPERFTDPRLFALGIFGLLPDADKLLGLQGVFHSIVLVGVVAVLLIGAEERINDERVYAPLVAALLLSHLLLDLLDGGPVFLLGPSFSPGFGLSFPTTISLGASPTSVGVANLLPEVKTTVATQGAATYTLIDGYGILSVLTFVSIVSGRKLRNAPTRGDT